MQQMFCLVVFNLSILLYIQNACVNSVNSLNRPLLLYCECLYIAYCLHKFSLTTFIRFWNTTSAEAKDVDGTKHSNQVQSMSLCGNMIVTCGMDDKVKFIDIANVPTYK